MNKFLVLFGLVLFSGMVSGQQCGGELSVLNLGDVSTDNYLNYTIYSTIDPNFMGTRSMDAVFLDPSGQKIHETLLQLNDSQYIVNLSVFVSSFWVDGLHRFNVTLTVSNSSNLNQILCRRVNTVYFEVESDRDEYDGDTLNINFKPLAYLNATVLSRIQCFGGICYNMTVRVPLNVSWGIDSSLLNLTLPSSWNTTDYDMVIQPSGMCINYTLVSGLFEYLRLTGHQYNLDREWWNQERTNWTVQQGSLTSSFFNCSNSLLNVSVEYARLDSDYRNLEEVKRNVLGELTELKEERKELFTKQEVALISAGVLVASYILLFLYVRKGQQAK